MAGLFEKDLRILLQRKQTFVLFLVIAIVLGFTTEGTFVVGYTTFCILIFVMSTISYDEFDNGLSFLMTLPVTRRTYVMGKYVLCMLSCMAAWIFSVIVCICENQVKGAGVVTKELLIEAVVLLPIVILLMDRMIPVQMKFGAEKSRIVMIAVMGIVGILVIGVKKAAAILDLPVDSIMEKIQGISDVQMIVGCVVFAIAATFLSMAISVKIMNRKEF